MSPAVAERRAFLRAVRRRIDPDVVGLVRTPRRRTPGLRREDVAELIGISDAWYGRFERGHAQLSLKALDRLATALRLDDAERRELLRLARPELAPIAHDPALLVATSLDDAAAIVRRLSHAPSLAALLRLAVGLCADRSGIDVAAGFQAFGRHPSYRRVEVLALCGPAALSLSPRTGDARVRAIVPSVATCLEEGRVAVADDGATFAPLSQRDMLRVRSYIAAPFAAHGRRFAIVQARCRAVPFDAASIAWLRFVAETCTALGRASAMLAPAVAEPYAWPAAS